MQDLGYVLPNSIIRAGWDTTDYAGASITRATNGSIRIYKDDSTTERASSNGITDTEDFDSVTGTHFLKIDLSDNTTAGFYAEDSEYFVKLVGAVIDGQTVNATLFRFKIGYGPSDVYKWQGNSVVVGVNGVPFVDVGYVRGDSQSAIDLKDFADAGYDPATNQVEGVKLTDTVTTYTGNTKQTGDAFARLGAPAGASVSADIAAIESQTDDIGAAGAGLSAVPWNPAWDAEVQSEVNDALVAYAPYTGTPPTAGAIADAVWDEAGAGHVTAGTFGARVDAAISSRSSHSANDVTGGTTVAAAVTAILAKLLNYVRLLVRKDSAVGNDLVTELDAINDNTGTGTGSFLNTTDSLEAIRDRGDSAWITGGDDEGPGPFGVRVNVKSGGTNLQSANVRATNGSETYRLATDSSGNVDYSLPADTWRFYVWKPNFVQDSAPLTIVVTADTLTGNNITMTYDPPGQTVEEEDPNMTAPFLTMHDAIAALRNSLGGTGGDSQNENFRQAARDAHEDFFAGSEWKEKLQQHRIQIEEPYSTGTVAFDLTGGSSERLVTLTNGTFPSWAAYGTLLIGTDLYRVVSRLSNTTLQLDETFCPTADIASGTSYILYKDAYLLPADFEASYNLNAPDSWKRCWIEPEDWLELSTTWRVGSDFRYTILFDERTPGRWSLRFYGYPSAAATLTFLYERRRKAPILDGTEANSIAGTIAVVNGSATVTGTNTAFSDKMIGSVLRIGDATNHPTHLAGRYPYEAEHIISAVASTTSLTLKTPVELSTGSGKKYRVTDPMSLDRTLHLALRKGVEAHYHLLAGSTDSQKRASMAAYQALKDQARESQSKTRGRDSVIGGESGGRPYSVVEQSVDD